MNILYNILAILFCLAVGYFFGSIPTSIWIGKLFYHQDPRHFGSHNAGGTNAGRLWGKKVGCLVIAIDMLKAVVPMWLCWALFTLIPMSNGIALCPSITNVDSFGLNMNYIIPWPVYWITTFGCMFGHCWPLFAQFKGGKGAAVYMGIAIFSSWMFGIIPSLIYLLVLKISKHVSLASIISPVISATMAWIWALLCMFNIISMDYLSFPMYGANLIPSWVYALCLSFLSIIVIIRHRANIKRLINGTEREITWMR